MENQEFNSKVESLKIDKFRNSINNKTIRCFNKVLDNNTFLHLMDYISLKRQYFIECYRHKEDILDNIYNGYKTLTTETRNGLEIYNVTKVIGEIKVGYNQNNQFLFKSVSDSNLIICRIDITTRAFSKDNNEVIIEDKEKLLIYLGDDLDNEII